MSVNNKQWYGLPLNLIWGYVAIAVFMTGDGFELAFLSHYIKALGFTPAQASFAFTLYGLAAALSAWVSGVVAEIITPRKAMLIGFVLWCVFHVLFLVFGLGRANYALILLFYGIRGLAYPLFLYSFIVAIIHNVRSDSSSSALGWFWAVYSVGIGVFGSYIPSFTIPHIGEMGTLWLALLFCATGGIIALVSMRHTETPRHMQNLTTREKFAELGRAATLLYTNRSILFSSIVRIINTLSLFGFAVIMPMMFVDELGFTTSEWLPDMMRVGSKDILDELVENDLVEDLSSVYEEYASDGIKKIYDSYDGRCLETATYDGKLMAMPGTNLDSAPCEVFIRQDWLDELGMDIDPDGDKCLTVDELGEAAKAFIEKDPGGTGNPVGLAFVPNLTAGDYSGSGHTMNAIASAYEAFPGSWLMDQDGKVYNSST